MAVEIERKVLVVGDSWRALAGPGRRIRQDHTARLDGASVRLLDNDGYVILTARARALSGRRGP